MPNEITQLNQRLEQLELEVYKDKSTSLKTYTNFQDFRGNLKIPNRNTTPTTCRVGELVEVSGTYYVCTAQDTWKVLPTEPISQLTTVSLTTGETITGVKALCVSKETTTTQSDGTNTRSVGIDTTTWLSQKFTSPATPLVGIKTVRFTGGGGADGKNYTVTIYTDNAGTPSSTVVGVSNSQTPPVAGTMDFSFSPLPLSASTVYHAVIKCDASGGSVAVTDVGGGGHGVSTTINSGSTWSDFTYGPMFYTFTFVTVAEGYVYNTNSTSNDFYANNFIGFSTGNISSGSTGTIVIDGIVTGLSGLTIGAIYYLQDTAGTIGTSAGSQSRKIGLALTATTLLIKHDNS